MIKSRLSTKLRKLLNNKFNIIEEIDLINTDFDFSILKNILLKTKKDHYTNIDKYIIIHYDTDYYLPHCPYGLTIFNLVKTFTEVDISLDNIIFVTSYPGIKKEFELLVPEYEQPYNLPIIIDNCITCFNDELHAIRNALPNNVVKIDTIEKRAVCMLGQSRAHRHILYNFIKKHNLFDKIATSFNNKKHEY